MFPNPRPRIRAKKVNNNASALLLIAITELELYLLWIAIIQTFPVRSWRGPAGRPILHRCLWDFLPRYGRISEPWNRKFKIQNSNEDTLSLVPRARDGAFKNKTPVMRTCICCVGRDQTPECNHVRPKLIQKNRYTIPTTTDSVQTETQAHSLNREMQVESKSLLLIFNCLSTKNAQLLQFCPSLTHVRIVLAE